MIFPTHEEPGCFGGQVITEVPSLTDAPDHPVRLKPLHMPANCWTRDSDVIRKDILRDTRAFFNYRQDAHQDRVPDVWEGPSLEL